MYLVEELRREELSILEDLRATAPYRRLQALREVLSHYDTSQPVGAPLDALLPDAPRHARAAAAVSSVIALPGPRAEVA